MGLPIDVPFSGVKQTSQFDGAMSANETTLT